MDMKYILLLIILTGCTAQKRCERHTDKAQKLGCLKIKNDTIIKYDTIKGFKIDTLVQYSDSSRVDTLYLVKDGVKSQTIIKWKDKVVSQTITKQDTIVKTFYINKNVEKIKVVSKIPWWVWAIVGVLGLFSMIVVVKK